MLCSQFTCVHCEEPLTSLLLFSVQSLQKVLVGYNNLQHVVYSLLLGRPVVVIGNRRQEGVIRDLVQALSLFVVNTPRYGSPKNISCQSVDEVSILYFVH